MRSVVKNTLKITGILLFVFVIYSFAVNRSQNKEVVNVFAEQNMHYISSGDIEKIKTLTSAERAKELENGSGNRFKEKLSLLGPIKSVKGPQSRGSSRTYNRDNTIDVKISFAMFYQFEQGEAVIEVELTKSNDSYLISKLKIDDNTYIN